MDFYGFGMSDFGVYLGLFFAAFLAATLLPMQSEALLAGLIISDGYSLLSLIAVASLGNVLGSTVNWWLGRYLEKYKDRRWFPVKQDSLEKGKLWYHRYGRWSLLLSWAPVIGDPLTMIAGILREPLWSFLVIVTVAKVARYCVVAAVVLGLWS